MRSDIKNPRHFGAFLVLLSAAAVGACSGNPSTLAAPLQSQQASGALPALLGSRFAAPEPPPTSTEFFAGISPNSTPRGIAKGPNGTWFTQPGTNQIARINATGAVKELSTLPAETNPNNIVEGSDGNLWFTEAGDRIGRITPRGAFVDYLIGNEAYGPFDITAGADGNLWFTFRSPSTNAIGRITTSGVVTLFTAGLSAGDPAVHDITRGPDGNVWFTEEFANKIGSITPSGVITEFTAGISSNANLVDITGGPDGNVWFTEFGSGKIGRITPNGTVNEFSTGISPGSNPAAIATAEGAVWFVEYGAARVAKISMAGHITEFASLGATDSDMTVGPGSDLWITDFSGNGIVQVTE
jgi:streptogramin lyase